MAVGRAMRAVVDAAVGFALPPRCPGCGAVVDGDHRFCAGCWSALDFLGEPACAACGVPLPHVGLDLCEPCRALPPAYAGARAAVAYGDIAGAVVLRLKYANRPGVARTLAALMARLLADAPADAVLVPVPLHRARLWSRGYNQSLLIARGLAARTGHAVAADALVRTRATPVLRGLGRAARTRAVAGAFAVRRAAAVAGRTVVLVDDVLTTGATVDACAAALRAGGAARVRVLCWARVVDGLDR